MRRLLITACFLTASASALLAEERVVFSEDFSEGVDRWDVLDTDTWRLKDGAFEITARESAYEPPYRSPWHVALVKDLSLGSGAVEFRVRSTLDTGGHRDCCVFFGWQDPAHFYYAHVGAQPDPVSVKIHLVDGADRRPLADNDNPVPWTDGWHTVRLERDVESGRIAVYFDGELIMSATDETFGAGRVGIGSFDDRDAFDDVRVLAAE